MKKLTVLLALLITLPVFAEESVDTPSTSSARDNYVGVRLHKNERMAFEYDTWTDEKKFKDDQFGFGAFIGNKLTDHVKIEFETAYTGTSFKLDSYTHDYDIWSNMINMYLFTSDNNIVEPYVGIGLGFAGIFADAQSAMGHLRETAFQLSWQFMVGVNFALNDRIDLNVGFKYQNYGTVDYDKANVVLASTDIDATVFYFSTSYKFGL